MKKILDDRAAPKVTGLFTGALCASVCSKQTLHRRIAQRVVPFRKPDLAQCFRDGQLARLKAALPEVAR